MSTKAKGTSVTQKLANLAKKRGARFEHVATEFLIERLVRRLVADKKLASLLVFKGGFVGLRVYNSSRYTVDLDALLRKSNLEATLALTREAAETDLDDGVWFRFESQVDLETQGEYGGIRQTFRAGFGELPKKLLKASIGILDGRAKECLQDLIRRNWRVPLLALRPGQRRQTACVD